MSVRYHESNLPGEQREPISRYTHGRLELANFRDLVTAATAAKAVLPPEHHLVAGFHTSPDEHSPDEPLPSFQDLLFSADPQSSDFPTCTFGPDDSSDIINSVGRCAAGAVDDVLRGNAALLMQGIGLGADIELQLGDVSKIPKPRKVRPEKGLYLPTSPLRRVLGIFIQGGSPTDTTNTQQFVQSEMTLPMYLSLNQ